MVGAWSWQYIGRANRSRADCSRQHRHFVSYGCAEHGLPDRVALRRLPRHLAVVVAVPDRASPRGSVGGLRGGAVAESAAGDGPLGCAGVLRRDAVGRSSAAPAGGCRVGEFDQCHHRLGGRALLATSDTQVGPVVCTAVASHGRHVRLRSILSGCPDRCRRCAGACYGAGRWRRRASARRCDDGRRGWRRRRRGSDCKLAVGRVAQG